MWAASSSSNSALDSLCVFFIYIPYRKWWNGAVFRFYIIVFFSFCVFEQYQNQKSVRFDLLLFLTPGSRWQEDEVKLSLGEGESYWSTNHSWDLFCRFELLTRFDWKMTVSYFSKLNCKLSYVRKFNLLITTPSAWSVSSDIWTWNIDNRGSAIRSS